MPRITLRYVPIKKVFVPSINTPKKPKIGSIERRIVRFIMKGWSIFVSPYDDAPCPAWAERPARSGRLPEIRKLNVRGVRSLLRKGLLVKRRRGQKYQRKLIVTPLGATVLGIAK